MEILTSSQILAVAPYFAALLAVAVLSLVFGDSSELF